MNKFPRYIMLGCFLVAGLWAGTIVTYMTISSANPDVTRTADILLAEVTEPAARFGDRLRGIRGDNSPRTQPYVDPPQPDPTIEDIIGSPAPVPDEFQFPAPVTETPEATPAPAPTIESDRPLLKLLEGFIKSQTDPSPGVTEPDASENPITGALGSLSRLFSGEGDFGDILKLVIMGFAIFGGAQFGGSDILFTTILGLFSKKARFNDIVEDRVATNRRRLLPRNRK